MLAPFVLAWLGGAVFGAISGNVALALTALVGLAGFGWLFWYCIAIGRVYRVVFSDDAVEFATVFRRGGMAKTDIAGWSRGRPNSGCDPSPILWTPMLSSKGLRGLFSDQDQEKAADLHAGVQAPVGGVV